jgi:hypothetical protein
MRADGWFRDPASFFLGVLGGPVSPAINGSAFHVWRALDQLLIC